MSEAAFHPEQRKVVQYVSFADDKDSDGHGTHVAGIAAGKVGTAGMSGHMTGSSAGPRVPSSPLFPVFWC